MKDIFIQQLGKKVRLHRKQRKLTQEILGGKAGVCPKYVGQIERAEKNPSLLVVLRIARALDLKFSDLVDADRLRPESLCHLERITYLLKRQEPARIRDIAKALELLLVDKT